MVGLINVDVRLNSSFTLRLLGDKTPNLLVGEDALARSSGLAERWLERATDGAVGAV